MKSSVDEAVRLLPAAGAAFPASGLNSCPTRSPIVKKAARVDRAESYTGESGHPLIRGACHGGTVLPSPCLRASVSLGYFQLLQILMKLRENGRFHL